MLDSNVSLSPLSLFSIYIYTNVATQSSQHTEMPEMAFLSLLLLLSLLCNLSGSTLQFLSLHDSSPQTLQALSHTGADIAVYVSNDHLIEVSNSILTAEKWLKTHVLIYYPSTKITTIVVGHNVLCNQTLGHVANTILPAMENLHYSLTRWGLNKAIEVSPSLSSNCLQLNPIKSQKLIKPLLVFLQNTNYSYSINPSPTEDPLFSLSSHTEWFKKMNLPNLGKINLLKISSIESKPMKLRRLSSMVTDPFPSRPARLSPIHSPVSFKPLLLNPNSGKINLLKIRSINSKPMILRRLSSMGTDPFPSRPAPLSPTHSPVSFKPHITLPPLVGPEFPAPQPSLEREFTPNFPPCNNPSPSPSPRERTPHRRERNPAPAPGREEMLWCVAKPTVPAETLQAAMDYACGEGGAECGAVGPGGSCFYPDTVVAHASYAFNSYWQNNKGNGGTCAFGGTAMLINADPSYSHCRFILA